MGDYVDSFRGFIRDRIFDYLPMTTVKKIQRGVDSAAIVMLLAFALFGSDHPIITAALWGWVVCLMFDCARYCLDCYYAEKSLER